MINNLCHNQIQTHSLLIFMAHILIVDDDNELSEMLTDYLQVEGYTIEQVFDGDAGVKKALSCRFDAVVLDVMMPKLDGFEVLRQIRSQSSVPVIMLTAKGDDIDRIVGLEIGADDYLSKPFNPRELLARLRAVLRRSQSITAIADKNTSPLSIGLLEIHPAARTAFIEGHTLDLTSTEFNLLQILVQQSGNVVTKESLSQQAIGRPLTRYDRSIDMHMSNLRKKLAEQGQGSLIITIRGQGYQLASE